MFRDLPEGQTNYCTHETTNKSGVCDECKGVHSCEATTVLRKVRRILRTPEAHDVVEHARDVMRVHDEYQQGFEVRFKICERYDYVKPEDANCPVCGYYCLGNGGKGCINKPTL